METAGKIRLIVVEVSSVACSTDDIGMDDDLIGDGIIDSLGLEDLMDRLEADFQITISDEQLDIANFATVRAIETLVRRLQ